MRHLSILRKLRIVLVKLTTKAFYDELMSKGENQPKSRRSENKGITVVILDALKRFVLALVVCDFVLLIGEQVIAKE
ncbi:hypothetical protein VNO78_07686 [Psophocarpus tetragonolobus]|uniref:Uncharacterized protein n=1 Tax=Psophocarpus tetragonolobus TaxID=3891 RepID=A0AAN9SWK5_PSOTE